MSSFPHAESFLDHILDQYLQDIRSTIENNYDADWFNRDGIDHSTSTYPELHKEMFKVLLGHADKLRDVYALFETKEERNLFIDLIRYRLAGHRHVRLPTNCPAFWERRQRAKRAPYTHVCRNEKGTVFKDCYAFAVDWLDESLRVISLGIECQYFLNQYFYEREDLSIKPEKGDHVIDAGSCLGDTALAFAKAVGPEGCVYLFDVLPVHHEIAKLNMANHPHLARTSFFDCGLSNCIFAPEKENGANLADTGFEPGFELPEENSAFPTTTIDHLVAEQVIERVDFIKMDIEGSEFRALEGAVDTLRRYRPKLAICLYHNARDFYEIPLFIQNLNLGYRFALGHYTIHAGETVLYAIPDSRTQTSSSASTIHSNVLERVDIHPKKVS